MPVRSLWCVLCFTLISVTLLFLCFVAPNPDTIQKGELCPPFLTAFISKHQPGERRSCLFHECSITVNISSVFAEGRNHEVAEPSVHQKCKEWKMMNTLFYEGWSWVWVWNLEPEPKMAQPASSKCSGKRHFQLCCFPTTSTVQNLADLQPNLL